MPLTALDRFSAEDLNPQETIVYRTHISFAEFFIRSIPFFFTIVLGILVLFLASFYGSRIGFPEQSFTTFGVFLLAAFFLIPGSYRLISALIDRSYDESIITNQRVVIHDQHGLFGEGVVTASIRSVEEVTLLQKGFLRTIFDFGSLQVKTAARGEGNSTGESLTLVEIPRPRRVQKLIDEIAYRVKREVEVVPEEVLKVCGL